MLHERSATFNYEGPIGLLAGPGAASLHTRRRQDLKLLGVGSKSSL
jgi:hypothetical protein